MLCHLTPFPSRELFFHTAQNGTPTFLSPHEYGMSSSDTLYTYSVRHLGLWSHQDETRELPGGKIGHNKQRKKISVPQNNFYREGDNIYERVAPNFLCALCVLNLHTWLRVAQGFCLFYVRVNGAERIMGTSRCTGVTPGPRW